MEARDFSRVRLHQKQQSTESGGSRMKEELRMLSGLMDEMIKKFQRECLSPEMAREELATLGFSEEYIRELDV